MDKVVGARISDSLYNKMKEDGRPTSEILRDALNKYFSIPSQKTDVNTPLTGVNKVFSESAYYQKRN